VRGAPAIGIAGAYGLYLAVRNSRTKSYEAFSSEVDKAISYLASSRPTASNLFWALGRVKVVVEKNRSDSVEELKRKILDQAHAILKSDRKESEAIGEYGKQLIRQWSSVLTHCNAGALATGGLGTALSVIFASREKLRNVYVDETRPVLQGARLTMWEMMKKGIPATLICDNMAASLMAGKEIDAVIVGADRIVSNGDFANKIGTYNLAVLCAYHKIPFYVAAPVSTFDLSLTSGKYIPIEQRSSEEVKKVNGSYITPKKASAINPAFDVTPAKLVTAIITEKGVVKRPDKKKIERLVNSV
ncbi:MAG: S-methyl-5-thioribose-1-phosphate isomerase, partial [Candidatus Omnitrophica bacterium]|nr:S-methyl-5-thioribose-1-phosphate isomerase [Candidatus Omnitrophota bacterium]